MLRSIRTSLSRRELNDHSGRDDNHLHISLTKPVQLCASLSSSASSGMRTASTHHDDSYSNDADLPFPMINNRSCPESNPLPYDDPYAAKAINVAEMDMMYDETDVTVDYEEQEPWQQEREELLEQIDALQQKLEHKQGALETLMTVHQALDETVRQQEERVRALQEENDNLLVAARQAQEKIDALQDQVQLQARLMETLQQPQPQPATKLEEEKAQLQPPKEVVIVQAPVNHNIGHDNDCMDDDGDDEVASQIAAVKASLGQLQANSNHARANHASLEQELAHCRRLQQQVASRNRRLDVQVSQRFQRTLGSQSSPQNQQCRGSRKHSLLMEQMTALVTAVQEREQHMAEIAQCFQGGSSGATLASTTTTTNASIPVSLYQAEIKQWKDAMQQFLEHSSQLVNIYYNCETDDDNDTLSSDDDDDDSAVGNKNTTSNSRQVEAALRKSNHLLHQANDKLQQLDLVLQETQQESYNHQSRAQSLFAVVQRLEKDKEEEIHLLDLVMEHLLALEQD